jgi:hypothetical protein
MWGICNNARKPYAGFPGMDTLSRTSAALGMEVSAGRPSDVP